MDRLASDPRFLRRRGWLDVAKDIDEIALGAVGPVDEREHTHEQPKQRDERKEDLVGDGAGEEGALVGGEAHDQRPAARNDAA